MSNNDFSMHLPSWLDHRCAGVLLHPSSLPGDQSIGCLNSSAYRWVDFLKESGFTYWQTCPLGPTGYGDSPYQVFSSSAGNPYFIDLQVLVKYSYLSESELNKLKQDFDSSINFGKLYDSFFPLLRLAFSRFRKNPYLIENN